MAPELELNSRVGKGVYVRNQPPLVIDTGAYRRARRGAGGSQACVPAGRASRPLRASEAVRKTRSTKARCDRAGRGCHGGSPSSAAGWADRRLGQQQAHQPFGGTWRGWRALEHVHDGHPDQGVDYFLERRARG